MTAYLLDTNICIAWLKKRPSVVERVITAGEHQIFLCSPVKAELQIAAIGLTHGLTVVTNNMDEFSRIPNLRIEDWLIPR